MEVHRSGVTASKGMFPEEVIIQRTSIFKEQDQLRLIPNGPFILSSTFVTQMKAKKKCCESSVIV